MSTTDGKLGDAIYQSDCMSASGQVWPTSLTAGSTTPATIENPASGLYLAVAANSIRPDSTIHGVDRDGQQQPEVRAF